MTAFLRKSFSVLTPGTDEYRAEHPRIFGEKPSKFCRRCDRVLAWCECPQVEPLTWHCGCGGTIEVGRECACGNSEAQSTLEEHPDPDDLEDYRRL